VTLAEFFEALRRHLNAKHVEYHAADLRAWCDAVWALAQEDPDSARWGDAYAVALAEANRLAEPPHGGAEVPCPWQRVALRVGRRLVWLRQC
jgi:hypothetical protein